MTTPRIVMVILEQEYKLAAETMAAGQIETSEKTKHPKQGGQEHVHPDKWKFECIVGAYGQNAIRQLLNYRPCDKETYDTHDVGPFDVKTRSNPGFGILMNEDRVTKAIKRGVHPLLVTELSHGRTYHVRGWFLARNIRTHGKWMTNLRVGGDAWLIEPEQVVPLDVERYTLLSDHPEARKR